MWFIGVEVEQETSAPPPKKNPGSAPGWVMLSSLLCIHIRSIDVNKWWLAQKSSMKRPIENQHVCTVSRPDSGN